MAQACFRRVRLRGIDTCTGPVIHRIDQDAHLYAGDPAQLDRLKKMVGLDSRHVAPAGITTLDLCEQSARRLLPACGVEPANLDAVICVTQTPDYWQPCNACLAHDRLGLPKTVAAFDINQGCSGWVYGLYVAATMVESGGCQRVLLLAGDTVSQTVHPADRAVRPLFGDAGTACLVERSDEAAPSWFALHSDGRGWQSIHIPAGAFRCPKSPETAREITEEDGSRRSKDHLHMNGVEVLNFTLREEPGAVRELLAFAGVAQEQVDFFVFHQANKFILTNLAKRLRVPLERVPMETAGRFGNQSSASVPATLCDALGNILRREQKQVLCSGFGVGLSWASCLLSLGPLDHCALHRFLAPEGGQPSTPG